MSAVGQKPIGDFRCGHTGLEVQQHQKAEGDVDIQRYSIVLDVDVKGQRINGYTRVGYKGVKPTTKLVLSLEGLDVDSVVHQNNTLNFSHKDEALEIDLPQSVNAGDTGSIKVYYGGKPIRDASWGGFYFSGDYAFNLGVAFTSNPHNYGRVWFPCVDNFTDRAVYDFVITCDDDKTAMCNGILKNEVNNGDGTKTYFWEMNESIPTYLASVAVAPYTFSQWLHKSGLPVVLSAVAADSLKMAKSFVNLNDCIDAFIGTYGPHTFDRVGFNLVPFNGGAMEHATNIAYPRFGADGELTYETLYAHEFGHHWWGNTVTCSTAEDMWINEGWASYSERVFLEWVYGKDRYDDDISANHKAVLHYAHLRDGDTLPVSGIGHEHTYGMHVYDKGADMVHTLRGYMGDTAFVNAVKSLMVEYKFKSISSDDLKTHFQKHTQQDLDAFFDNWIYNSGFPHFQILGHETVETRGVFHNNITLGQRLRMAPKMFTNVPLDITLMSSNFETYTKTVVVSGERTDFKLITNFEPAYIAIDMGKKISDAITDDYIMVKDTGFYSFGDAMMTMKVSKASDSSLVRVEHHWVGADAYFNPEGQPFLSRERYWTVDGVWSNDFAAEATIEYYGRETGSNYALGYLDVDLIRNNEEGLVLMYRPTASSNWEECQTYTWDMGSKFDKRGSFTIQNLRKGQYAFAIKDESRASVNPIEVDTKDYVTVYPNPAKDILNVEVNKAKNAQVEITDAHGRLMYSDAVTSRKCCKPVDVSSWVAGVYFVGIVIDNQPYKPVPVLVR